MYIGAVAEIIHKIASGLEECCIQCMDANRDIIHDVITEQLYSGFSANETHLSPSYDDDPYFEEKGPWYHRPAAYKEWKRDITPPSGGVMLNLPPRPDNIPNLTINGTFYSEITVRRNGDIIVTDPGTGNGPDIVAHYQDELLNLGPTAKEYFNSQYMLPAIGRFFKNSGYE